MERQEFLQRQVDNFWGLDKDLKDRNQEIAQMHAEDRLSRHVERDIKILAQQKIWDAEFAADERYRIQREKDRRAYMRVDHLRLVNSPLSVEELLHNIWNLDPEDSVAILPQIASLSLATNAVANVNGSLGYGNSNVNNSLEFLQESIASMGSMRMSLHLEGLQQTREIINQASGEFRAMLKDLKVGFNSTTDATLKSSRRESDTEHRTSAEQQPTIHNKAKHTTISTTSRSADKLQQIEAQLELEKERNRRFDDLYDDAVEGHGTLHWDQEQLLHQTFLLLDNGNKGYLTKEELATISFDPRAHELLQFTVFWSLIKKKEWHLFDHFLQKHEPPKKVAAHPQVAASGGGQRSGSGIFLKPISRAPSLRSSLSASSVHSNQGSNPQSNTGSQRWSVQKEVSLVDRYHNPPRDTLPYNMWFEAALSLSRETQVSLRHIRSITEHVQLSRQFLEASVTVKFPGVYWNHEHCGPLRDYRLMRQLRVGDCVWVLHRKGVRWLPAVIEHIHYPYTSTGVQQGDNMSVHSGLSRQHYSSNANDNQSIGSAMSLNSVTSAAEIPRRLHHQYCRYDVYYPLNHEELAKSRLATTSRQLLALPSEQMAHDGMLPIRDYPQERAVCGYAFDLVDVDAQGLVEVDVLVSSLQSPAMAGIVSTSLVLATIFQGEVVIPQLPGDLGLNNNGQTSPAGGPMTPSGLRSRQSSGIFAQNSLMSGAGPGSPASPGVNQPIYVGKMKRTSQVSLALRREKEKAKLRQRLRDKLPWWQRTDSAPARPSLITVFCDTFAEMPPPENNPEDLDSDGKGARKKEDGGDTDQGYDGEDGHSGMRPRKNTGDEHSSIGDDEDMSRDDESGGSPRRNGGNNEPPPCISKMDFLEFCEAVLDIVRYDLPTLHHHMQQ